VSGPILIADDHAELRDVLSDYLRAEGYVVDQAANGASALDAARGEAPDGLVLDLNKPDADGTQLLREWSASSISAASQSCLSRHRLSFPKSLNGSASSHARKALRHGRVWRGRSGARRSSNAAKISLTRPRLSG
jgi:CheY-like chemotaxis protein